MDSRIIIATHKEYWMPEDKIYLPVLVGAALKTDKQLSRLGDYQRDDEGENISGKNKNYCELTALYWAWKNLKADYIGLVHYRRHFTIRGKGSKQERVLTGKDLKRALRRSDIVLPKKRNYYIETNYSQYAHAHNYIDLDKTREILGEKYPDYLEAYDEIMIRTSGHRFNMFIMKDAYFREYCEWLFDILFELEKRLDISDYSDNDKRVFGFVSERLLDVWIETKGYDYIELPYIFMEHQNWITKGLKFLIRKFKK
ncbi:protein of unknown function [Lachnospiraceae bacterium]|nr:protein of unknown function [Lachnospiraceae bacterium]